MSLLNYYHNHPLSTQINVMLKDPVEAVVEVDGYLYMPPRQGHRCVFVRIFSRGSRGGIFQGTPGFGWSLFVFVALWSFFGKVRATHIR